VTARPTIMPDRYQTATLPIIMGMPNMLRQLTSTKNVISEEISDSPRS